MVGSWYQNVYITLNSSSEWCVCLKLLLGKNISVRHIYWHQLSSFFFLTFRDLWNGHYVRWFMIIINQSLGRSVEAAQGFGGNGGGSCEWITLFDHERSLVDYLICGISATLNFYRTVPKFASFNTGNSVPSLNFYRALGHVSKFRHRYFVKRDVHPFHCVQWRLQLYLGTCDCMDLALNATGILVNAG